VVGAGLAGLNAATVLAQAGLPYRSAIRRRGPGALPLYFDPSLGLTIDNGNHLVLASNPAVKAFRARIGADEPLAGPPHAEFAFADLGTGERWTLRINDGPIPGGSPCRLAACRGRGSPTTCRWANCCWARARRRSAM
jgi:hypothetical protein